jgi:hypothetical protein
MNPTADLADTVRRLLAHLKEDAGGPVPLAVRDDDRCAAVQVARHLLIYPKSRKAHYALAAEVFPNPPVPSGPFDPARAVALAAGGPDDFENDELARVLLVREPLGDVSLMLEDVYPKWWLDALRAVGEQFLKGKPAVPRPKNFVARVKTERERTAADLLEMMRTKDRGEPVLAGARAPEGPNHSAAGAELARRAYGDPNTPFALKLHGANGGGVTFELLPAPVSNVALTLELPGAPLELVIEASSGRSLPSAELPEEAFAFDSLELRLRNEKLVVLVR